MRESATRDWELRLERQYPHSIRSEASGGRDCRTDGCWDVGLIQERVQELMDERV